MLRDVRVYGAFAALIAIALTVASSIFSWSFYLPSTVIVMLLLVPLLMRFEQSRPDAKEIAVIAVVCALAIISRVAFVEVPFLKPTAAIIALSAFAFGPRIGSFCGAISMLASNMIFGQGIWTPWQMLAFASTGLFFGAIGRTGIFSVRPLKVHKLLALAMLGFLFVVVVEGPILDTCALFMMVSRITPSSVIAIYAAGLVPNAIQGAATLLVIAIIGNPMLAVFERAKRRYLGI